MIDFHCRCRAILTSWVESIGAQCALYVYRKIKVDEGLIMKKLVVLFLAILPALAQAESSGDHGLLRVEVGDTGFNIYASDGDFGSAACASGGASNINHAVSFRQSDFPNGYSHLLSTALAAHMGGKKVSMWYVGCQDSPWNNGKMPKPATLVVK